MTILRITRSPTSLSALLVALLLACAAPAWGQGNDKDRQAREFFLKGKKAYQQGLYEEAMKNFKAALDVRPSPILEYNIGRCHDKLGQQKEAIAAYKRYLVSRPNAPNRETVKARIAALEALVNKPDPPAAPAAPETPAAPATPAAAPPEEPGQPGAALGKPTATEEPAPAATATPAEEPAAKKPAANEEPVHEAMLAMKSPKQKPRTAGRAPSGPLPAPAQRKEKPVYKKWYFWVAVAGAVVITGFIIGMAVDSDDRTISSSHYPVTSGHGGGMTVLTF